jgi:hypothetical protein
VSAELPETGERFEGLLPPVVAAPAFAIRKPAVAVFTLSDYVAAAVADRRNILVAGGTSDNVKFPRQPYDFRPSSRNACTASKQFKAVFLHEDGVGALRQRDDIMAPRGRIVVNHHSILNRFGRPGGRLF